jgi:phosphomannomutase
MYAGTGRQYVQWDPNPSTRDEIHQLVAAGDEAALEALLSSRLKFGTAGLRGKMGAGYCRMNDLVVLQTAQVQ